MRTLLANATGTVRRVQIHGRQFLVAPVTMIVPGVLAGSNGPLYYPPEEVSKDPQRWNGVPLTLGHPRSADGHPISGRSPEILNTHQLGNVYRTRWDGKALRAEAWFDEELTKKNGPDVHANLLQGKVTELSTGLFTDDEPVSNGKDPISGKEYTHVARNYRPDHLAILPGVKGACSVSDGCGVLVNARYSFDSEECPHCKAVMEGDPDSGRCNRCRRRHGKWVGKGKENAHGQPHSSDTGRFKKPSAGTGKAETRDGALLGSMVLTDEDVTLGTAAAVHAVTVGTPGAKPPWASDLAKWERATALAVKGGDPPDSHRYYAVAVHIYRGLGGGFNTTPSANVGLDMTPDKACKILHDGSVHGKPLTERQRGMFGAQCGLGKKNKGKSKRNSSGDRPMATKTENIATLTANCECWKGKGKVLEAMDEGLVQAIHNEYEESTENALVVNELREEFGIDEDEVKTNAIPAFFKKKVKAKDAEPDDDDAVTDDDDDEDDGMTSSTKYKKNQRTDKGGTNVTLNKALLLEALQDLSQDEILSLPGMSGLRERDYSAKRLDAIYRTQLVDKLAANTKESDRKARREHLMKLNIADLEDRVKDLPTEKVNQAQTQPHGIFLGAGPTGNTGADEEFKPKPMVMPKINWAEEKKILDAAGKARVS